MADIIDRDLLLRLCYNDYLDLKSHLKEYTKQDKLPGQVVLAMMTLGRFFDEKFEEKENVRCRYEARTEDKKELRPQPI